MARRTANNSASTASAARQVRCAIYTRKSTEEGLEQEFNSLDAQTEACASYICSQRHEGWVELKARYDDGGFSGGNMQRPGLQRLLADVSEGKVDVIVVYKVDRLTRSLADFAKIVDVLDARGASFVSVTQSFNTTTSMGRLTLNVLLSFAQFEREVTGERIRDKIAASKKKGMWMGGPVPLGYRVHERKLVIDEAGAATVRHIFSRYAALGNGRELIEELRADGYRTRQRTAGDRIIGGVPFGRGMLFALLSNPIYIGRIGHKGEVHEGEHDAIISRELWDGVQRQMERNRVDRTSANNARHSSLLAGIITDPLGRRMSPGHAQKGSKRYRYYVTHASELHDGGAAAHRLPAIDVEDLVVDHLRRWLTNAYAVRQVVGSNDGHAIAQAVSAAARRAETLQTIYGRRAVTAQLIEQVKVANEAVHILLHRSSLAAVLGCAVVETATFKLSAAAVKMRYGKETKLILTGEREKSGKIDNRLVQLLVKARAAQRIVASSPERSIRQIALDQKLCRHRFVRLLRLAWLAPSIMTDILEGRQPQTLTSKLLLEADLPPQWERQRVVLGYA